VSEPGKTTRAGRLAIRSLVGATAALATLALAAVAPPRAAAGQCLTVSASKDSISSGAGLRLEGRACAAAGAKRVRFVLQGEERRSLGGARLGRGGRFAHRVRVSVAPGEEINVRATAGSAWANLKLKVIGERNESATQGGPPAPAKPAPVAPQIPASQAPDPGPGQVSSNCELAGTQPGPATSMSVGGCRLIASDTSSNDPRIFWGNIECGTSLSSFDPSRHQILGGGSDPHPTATGATQSDDSYRELTVRDGDDIWGERCELGRNDHRTGPTAFYREGQRRTTYVSLRLPHDFPVNANAWQTVLQMKQAQPYIDALPMGVAFEIGAYNGRLRVTSFWTEKWSVPAPTGVWTRIAIDGYYTQSASNGWLRVSIDVNADGDFSDQGERSPVIPGATLAHEPSNGGATIPSHLRTGIYHNPSIPCPPPGGCSIDVDNVQVVAP
jgi:hypothetical protein